MIPVILVTGFLGSGKTTFLKQLARTQADRRCLYLVNDFASVDVDGEWVRQAGVPVLALSGGSIFCRCLVTDFIRVLRQVVAGDTVLGAPPEAVIIEASGMADPRVIHQMLVETRLDAHLAVWRILAVVDPGTFHKLLHTLPNIRAQVACADTVLISKGDRYPPDVVDRTREAVQAIQPEALCLPMIMGVADLDLWAAGAPPEVAGEYARCVDPNVHRFTLEEGLPVSRDAFRALVDASGDALYRAKGFIREDDQVYAVEWSSSGIRDEPWVGPPLAPRLVCIVRADAGPRLEALWRGGP